MKRIKKMLLKPFKKRGTPSESSTEFDRNSKGEHSSRDLRADKPDGADLTIPPDTSTLDISTLTPRHDGGSATCEWDRLPVATIVGQTFASHPNSTARTGTYTDGFRGSAERS